ncbi:Alpha-mannosidase [Meloidogyne graminicola]|uniref:Alpha-mannosidase n=1 Tax=Meloidogyne graminicola TaxID=189291 RepID=A0A8T0A316_9BILA|nr:Alpha-mannosidase [Meloidogyne graminicola]
MDRILLNYLRAADILFSLANWKGKMPTTISSLYNSLINARRSLSLFQHHDGVTGTAKTHVMDDYGWPRQFLIQKNIISRTSEFLLEFTPKETKDQFKVDSEHFKNKLPEKIILKEGTIIVVNSLGYLRKEIICIYVKNKNTKIVGKDNIILQQIEPIFYTNENNKLTIYKDKYSLCFEAELPPFGLVSFNLLENGEIENKVKLQTYKTNIETTLFETTLNDEKELYLSNEFTTAFFNKTTGYLKSIKINNEKIVDIFLSFVRYGARKRNPARTDGGDSLSGAYLFLPDGPAVEIDSSKNQFVIVKGPVRQCIHVNGPLEFGIIHQLCLDKNSKEFTLLNQINMESTWLLKWKNLNKNIEIAMNFKIPSIIEDNFFTDLNVQPFIENLNDIRVSLYGRQALGVASLNIGELQIMLDRRLLQDDDLGLGQSIEDNIQTESLFYLNIEKFNFKRSILNDTIGFHSLSDSLPSFNSFFGLKQSFPCDIFPVAFRTLSEPTIYSSGNRNTLPKYEAALILKRFGIECNLDSTLPNGTKCDKSTGNLNLNNIFTKNPRSITKGTLTLILN